MITYIERYQSDQIIHYLMQQYFFSVENDTMKEKTLLGLDNVSK